MLLEDVARTTATLRRLKDLGIKLAIDDFGTGFSSLNYLKRLPVDMLKIDRSFVAGIGKNRQDMAIVQTVVFLARALGLEVTAEGVETPLQMRLLRALKCDFGQGYLFAKPLPVDRIDTLLSQQLP